MPLYDFACQECNEPFESLVRKESDIATLICPKCSSPKIERDGQKTRDEEVNCISARSRAAFAKARLQIAFRRKQGRRQTKRHARHTGKQQRKSEHHVVHVNVVHLRQICRQKRG